MLNVQAVSNREYEQREQDKISRIKLLNHHFHCDDWRIWKIDEWIIMYTQIDTDRLKKTGAIY